MPRRGENIYKRKDGRWEGRYLKPHLPGEKARYGYVYARSYREVRDKLQNAVSVQKESLTFLSKEGLFSDIAEEWLQNRETQVKESTAARYRYLITSYLLPQWQIYTMNEITVEALQDYGSRLMRNGGVKGRGLSAKTVADILVLLKSILKYAVNKGYYASFDMRSVSVKQHYQRLRVLSVMEQQKMCEYLYSDMNGRNMGILLCLFTGMRVGEVCALQWEDINLEEGVLYVRHTMQRVSLNKDEIQTTGTKTKIVISSPKSACSLREIPLSDSLLLLLKKYPHPHMGFFLTGSTEIYCEPRQMQHQFKRILKKCGVEDAHFHTLRHTFATRCVELGVDVKSLSEILGHANINITMNRYVHPSMELKRVHMQKMEGLMHGESGHENY